MKQAVIFVDDEAEILASIKRMMRNEEFIQYYADSAKDAMSIIDDNHIDVVVSDMMMPEMNGLEFLSGVKEKHPEIVRIVLSGFTHVPMILSAIKEGDIFRYITKPWKLNDSAKNTIYEALEYSRYLRDQGKNNLKDFFFSVDNINSIFAHLNKGCIATKTDDTIIFISKNITFDIKINLKLSEALKGQAATTIPSEDMIIYIY